MMIVSGFEAIFTSSPEEVALQEEIRRRRRPVHVLSAVAVAGLLVGLGAAYFAQSNASALVLTTMIVGIVFGLTTGAAAVMRDWSVTRWANRERFHQAMNAGRVPNVLNFPDVVRQSEGDEWPPRAA
jgi:F0F1-type ATP synthase assembly protein I